MTTALRENTDLVRRANEGLNDQDPAAFAEHHADDLVLHDAGEEIRGVEAALERERAIWRAFPDLHHTLDDVIAEGAGWRTDSPRPEPTSGPSGASNRPARR